MKLLAVLLEWEERQIVEPTGFGNQARIDRRKFEGNSAPDTG
jgi:hypothetical protein